LDTEDHDRRYPRRPIVGVGAVIFPDDGHVVLIRRARDPFAGQWSLPGGALEVGETLVAAVAREVREETGLIVRVEEQVDVVDQLLADDDGRVQYHFVILDYRCVTTGGVLAAGGDVDAVAIVALDALDEYHVADRVRAAITRALEGLRES
jgi:mutator protein MutT